MRHVPPVLLLLLLLLLLLPRFAMSQTDTAAQQLHALLAEAWEFQLRELPLFATYAGDPRYNDRLDAMSEADLARRNAAERGFLARLEAIDRAALPAADRLSRDLFERVLQDSIGEFDHAAHLIPITNREGFHINLPRLPDEVPLRTVKDHESYIARLAAVRRYIGDHIGLLRAGMKAGRTLPRIVMDGYEGTIAPHVVKEAKESLFHAPFTRFPASFSEADRQRLAAAGEKAILESVVPGYADFLAFMTREYLPACRATIAAADLPGGRAFYAHRVRLFTTLEVSPEDVHQTGLREVERLRREMELVMAKTGFQGTFAQFLEHLRTDKRFYVDRPEALLKEVAYILKRMDGELPRLFRKLPRMPYGLKAVPDFVAPKTTGAYYSQPGGDGTRAGTYFLNTYNLASRPLYVMEALSLHEAVPGHHLQIALQQEIEGLPPFRRFFEVTAFVEGWALYAERLGLELGFYTDPYSDFGRLTYEMWRACRLVVDTGIHALGWSRERAIDFLGQHTALSLHEVTTEVDRYIAWPGQALAYKTGELKISELRRRAEAELGPRFDVRELHDVILRHGPLPLLVLEAEVVGWIGEVKRRG